MLSLRPWPALLLRISLIWIILKAHFFRYLEDLSGVLSNIPFLMLGWDRE